MYLHIQAMCHICRVQLKAYKPNWNVTVDNKNTIKSLIAIIWVTMNRHLKCPNHDRPNERVVLRQWRTTVLVLCGGKKKTRPSSHYCWESINIHNSLTHTYMSTANQARRGLNNNKMGACERSWAAWLAAVSEPSPPMMSNDPRRANRDFWHNFFSTVCSSMSQFKYRPVLFSSSSFGRSQEVEVMLYIYPTIASQHFYAPRFL